MTEYADPCNSQSMTTLETPFSYPPNVSISFGELLTMSGHKSPSLTAKDISAVMYGVVIHDFVAERPDELDAKAGEEIVVISQANFEWFLAKLVNRLGGPGLIPICYVKMRKDMKDIEEDKVPIPSRPRTVP